MKLRYFLRGLGAGIIFAVLILGISGGASEKETLTDNEIIARARELGMVTKDEKLDESLSQIMGNQMDNQKTENDEESTDSKDSDGAAGENEDTDSESNEEAEKADAEKDSADKESEDSEKSENKAEASNEPEAEPESVLPEPLEEEETQVTSKLTISPGMSSAQVSRAFEKMGLVDDAEEFDDYLCNNGYSSRICVGTFTIEGKPGYAELARIITTK